jgi:hypothetical protein
MRGSRDRGYYLVASHGDLLCVEGGDLRSAALGVMLRSSFGSAQWDGNTTGVTSTEWEM